MNHSWKHDGPPAGALFRECELCGAKGRRSVSGAVPQAGGRPVTRLTRWETRLNKDSAWVGGRVPPCPVKRPGTYVSVNVLIDRRLRAEGIVPQDAEVALEHLPGDWRQRSTPEHPAWLARWQEPGGPRMVFSCWSMRRCAEAPELLREGDQLIPARRGGGA